MTPDRPPIATLPRDGAGERRAAVRGVAWGGVETAVTAAVGFVLTPLVLRVAGLSGLGLWAAAWSLAHTTGIFDLGVGASYARFTSRALALHDLRALNGVVGAGVGFHLSFSLLVGLLACAAAPRTLAYLAGRGADPAEAPVVLGCTVAVVLLRMTLSAYRGVVAGAQRIDLLARIGSVMAVVEGCGAVLCLLTGLGLRGMAWNALAAAALASLAEGVAAHRLCPGLRLRPYRASRSDWREILGFGVKLQATRASEILAGHAPRLVLALGPGLFAAGIYDLGARIAGALNITGRLPLPVLQPLASRLEASGAQQRLLRLLRDSTRYVALLVIPAAALIVLDADGLLELWTGRAVPPGAGAVARILAIALTLGLLASPLRLVLRGIGLPGIEAAAAGGGSLTNLLLAITLAIPLGVAGVAGAALAGTLVSVVVIGVQARRRAPSLVGAALLRTPLLGCGGGLVALAAAWGVTRPGGWGTSSAGRLHALLHLAPEAIVVGGVFLILAIVCGLLRRDDLAMLRDLRPRTLEGAGSISLRAGGAEGRG
jgi:O-antigen/teichoic acid export membrane protein